MQRFVSRKATDALQQPVVSINPVETDDLDEQSWLQLPDESIEGMDPMMFFLMQEEIS